MTHPNRRQFVLWAWLGVLANGASGFLAIVANAPDANDALSWLYYGSALPATLLHPLWSLVWAGFILGSVLFALGFSWSKWLLLCVLVITQLLNLLSGIYVTTALETFMSYLAMWLFWVPFVLSFFEPCSTYFSPSGVFGNRKDWTSRVSNQQ